LFVPLARADTITPLFFDGFENDTPDKLNATLVNWWTTSGAVDVLGAGNLCGTAGGLSNCLDLDGTSSKAGTIQSKESFAVGPGAYRLSFDLAGANRGWLGSASNTVNISFGGFYSEAFTMLQYDPFQTFTRDILVASPGTANIVFDHEGADWIGILLDNVSLSQVVFDIPDVPEEPNVIPTPEPATWTLLGAALGLVALRYRRMRV
jgi:hypothetical protein